MLRRCGILFAFVLGITAQPADRFTGAWTSIQASSTCGQLTMNGVVHRCQSVSTTYLLKLTPTASGWSGQLEKVTEDHYEGLPTIRAHPRLDISLKESAGTLHAGTLSGHLDSEDLGGRPFSGTLESLPESGSSFQAALQPNGHLSVDARLLFRHGSAPDSVRTREIADLELQPR